MRPWYERAFGPWYSRLYPHRDRDEAVQALAAFAPWISAEGRILDVACGAGRHLQLLLEGGRDAYGVDRSWTLLRESPVVPTRLVRADMRELPFASGSFAALLSLFTSFGYFEDRAAHGALLRELGRVSRAGGALILDLLNPEAVRTALVPRSERTVEGHRVIEERRLLRSPSGERVRKEVTVRDRRGAEVERYYEEVALFEPDELAALLSENGWATTACLGDYEGRAWSRDSSRLIAVARREGR